MSDKKSLILFGVGVSIGIGIALSGNYLRKELFSRKVEPAMEELQPEIVYHVDTTDTEVQVYSNNTEDHGEPIINFQYKVTTSTYTYGADIKHVEWEASENELRILFNKDDQQNFQITAQVNEVIVTISGEINQPPEQLAPCVVQGIINLLSGVTELTRENYISLTEFISPKLFTI